MATSTTFSSIWTNRTPTNAAWSALLLKNVGAPITLNNVRNVLRWMAAENAPKTWATRNNPLNASLNTNKSDGTGDYADLTTAAQNTASMIVYGAKGGAIGAGIYNSLMNDSPTDQFSAAVVDSRWSGNHYGVASAGASKPYPGRLSTYLTEIPVPETIPSTEANAGSGIASKVKTAFEANVSANSSGCNAKPPIIDFGGIGGVGSWSLSACNGKAISAGFLVALGAIITITGLVMIAIEKDPTGISEAAFLAATKA